MKLSKSRRILAISTLAVVLLILIIIFFAGGIGGGWGHFGYGPAGLLVVFLIILLVTGRI